MMRQPFADKRHCLNIDLFNVNKAPHKHGILLDSNSHEVRKMILKRWIKKSFILGMSATLLVPGLSHALGEASVLQELLNRQRAVPLMKPSWGNFIFHTDTLNKLYSLRGHQAIWVDSNGLPNSMAQALRSALQSADRHGLTISDYWDVEVENLFNGTQRNPKNWITFELGASEALIRYVTHLSTGRFDPEKIDTDIKFKKKTFSEYAELIAAISSGESSLASLLDTFAPSHSRYQDLVDILGKLRNIKDRGGWPTLSPPGVILKLGAVHPIIGQLRERLNQLGYPVTNVGGNTFDSEFEQAVKQYQAMNGLGSDGILGARSAVFRTLNFTVSQRISQVELTMEKLRWLPKSIEARHIFVNLATSEFNLFDEQGLIKHFKTINGDPFHRTPTMRDRVTHLILNPFWTVPRSIALNETLPKLRSDRNYLAKANMVLMDERINQIVDTSAIDLSRLSNEEFVKKAYYFRQLPGFDNALGVVKFPLVENKFSIYLHDTEGRDLFNRSERHLSHGCVRLEEPLGVATYLLQDQGWNFDLIRDFVPYGPGFQGQEPNKIIFIKKAMPVYLLYLTVEKGENGVIRFIDDDYGQDIRLSKALQNKRNANELF